VPSSRSTTSSRGAVEDEVLIPFLVTGDGTRSDGTKLRQGEFRLDLSTERVVGHWNRLPSKVVTTPSLSEFKDVWMHSS